MKPRSDRLRAITDAVTGATPLAEVARTLIAQGIEALAADSGAVALIEDDGRALELVETVGWSPAQLEAHRRIPLDARLPIADAARTGEPRWGDDAGERAASVPLSVDGRVIGAFAIGFPVHRALGSEERGFVLALAHAMAQALGRAQLHQAERRARLEVEAARQRLAILSDASAALAEMLDLDVSLDRVAQIAASMADACTIDLLEAARLRRAALALGPHQSPGSPLSAALAQTASGGVEPEEAAARVLRTGEGESLPVSCATSPVDRILAGGGARWRMVVPLWARGRAVGTLSLFYGASLPTPAPADLALARELGLRVALAVENAQLLEDTRRARHDAERAAMRTARLQAMTASLGRAVTPLEVADVVIAEGIPALGASAGALALHEVSPEGRSLRMVRSEGFADSALSSYGHRIPLDADLPLTDAVLRGEPLFFETEAALLDRYPGLGGVPRKFHAWAALPLTVEDRPLGVITLAFLDRRSIGIEDRAFAMALARQCAQAIDRALLFDAQRTARAAAEEARERVAFLAEASSQLASTLDWTATLERVVRLTVPRLADWCVIDLRGDEDGPLGVAIAHVDPQKEMILRDLRRRHPPFAEGENVMGDPETARALADVGFETSLVVPLIAHGQNVGVLSLGASSPDCAFGPEDVAIVEELAHRAAFAVANARLYAEAQLAIRSRDDFLSVASHELRTPLTALQLQLQALQRRLGGLPGDVAPELAPKIEVAARQTRRLVDLVDALLDISRITAGRLDVQLDDVDLVAAMREAIARQQEAIARSGSVVHVEAPASLRGRWDPMRVDQVLTNLVSNAIKYGEGQPITVKIECDGGIARVCVADRGIGIPPDKQTRIFDRFERAVSVRHYGGLGLGLWIVRQIVEALGGRIAVESEEHRGSTFRVELPIAGPPRPPSPPPAQPV